MQRDPNNYEKDLKARKYGIKNECVFNSLNNFHIAENVSIDCMHDFCEGIYVSTVEGILTDFILIRKILDLDLVNSRIESFNYGTAESKNIPQPLYIDTCAEGDVNNTGLKSKVRCKQSAAEMLCLTKYLGLMIGDLISDPNDPY